MPMGLAHSTPQGPVGIWALDLGENSSTPHIVFCDCEWGCITLITNTIFIIQITICHMPNVIKKFVKICTHYIEFIKCCIHKQNDKT